MDAAPEERVFWHGDATHAVIILTLTFRKTSEEKHHETFVIEAESPLKLNEDTDLR